MELSVPVSLVAAGLIAWAGPTPVQADFIEDFDGASYGVNDTLPSPWSPGPAHGNLMYASPSGSLYGWQSTQFD